MDCEDGFAAFEVGMIHDDLTIESPGSHQRRVQHLRCVGSSHDDDAPGRIEAVHLGQQLIERLFSLIIAENPSAPAGARFSDRIQFIDKDDTGSLLLGLFKQISNSGAPTPTNISINSEPEMEKNGTPASPLTALASRVLPVPGGPTISTPFGILPPSCWYFRGCLRKSTTSISSVLASSTPATSLKLTLISVDWSWILARLLPKVSGPGV